MTKPSKLYQRPAISRNEKKETFVFYLLHFFALYSRAADADVSWRGLFCGGTFSVRRVRLLLPVSVVPQYVNKCNKRRGGWVGGWMDDLAFYWYRFALCMYAVWLLDFISNLL